MRLTTRDYRTIKDALVIYRTYTSEESPHLYSHLIALIEKVNNLLLSDGED